MYLLVHDCFRTLSVEVLKRAEGVDADFGYRDRFTKLSESKHRGFIE